jgi:hypothetical protein
MEWQEALHARIGLPIRKAADPLVRWGNSDPYLIVNFYEKYFSQMLAPPFLYLIVHPRRKKDNRIHLNYPSLSSIWGS